MSEQDDAARWCSALETALNLARFGGFERLLEVRALLGQMPEVFLPAVWRELAAEARVWVNRECARVQPFDPPAGLMSAALAEMPRPAPRWAVQEAEKDERLRQQGQAHVAGRAQGQARW